MLLKWERARLGLSGPRPRGPLVAAETRPPFDVARELPCSARGRAEPQPGRLCSPRFQRQRSA